MSEQESAWYYTQHGERKGPVTLEVLRGAIEHSKIDREKDLIWGPGLSDWVTMDKVPELQAMPAGAPPVVPVIPSPPVKESSVSTAPASAIASSAKPISDNPYESPESLEDDNALADAMAARREGGGSLGLGRLGYVLWSLLLNVAGVIVVFTIASRYKTLVDETALPQNGLVIGVLASILVVAVLGLLISLSRLKNLSMSRLKNLS